MWFSILFNIWSFWLWTERNHSRFWTIELLWKQRTSTLHTNRGYSRYYLLSKQITCSNGRRNPSCRSFCTTSSFFSSFLPNTFGTLEINQLFAHYETPKETTSCCSSPMLGQSLVWNLLKSRCRCLHKITQLLKSKWRVQNWLLMSIEMIPQQLETKLTQLRRLQKKIGNFWILSVILAQGHANLLCIIPILTDGPFRTNITFTVAPFESRNSAFQKIMVQRSWVWYLQRKSFTQHQTDVKRNWKTEVR